MKRTLILVITILLVIAASVVFAGRPIVIHKQKPKIAVLPAQVENGNYEICREVQEGVYEAFEQMDMMVVDSDNVVETARDLGVRLSRYSSRFSSGVNIGRSASVDEEDLLRIGRRLGVSYVANARLKVWEKTTTHFPFGTRLNGRCQIEVIVVDVGRGEVYYEYPGLGESIEFGVAKKDDWKTFGGPLGGLMAFGALGKGRTTRTIGWAALIASHTIKGGGSDQLQYEAAVRAINTVLGDFYALYRSNNR